MFADSMKSLLRHLFKIMPWGAQESLFDAFCETRGRYKVFRRLGKDFNVHTLGINGKYGEIYGSFSDESIIAGYARTGNWAGRTIRLLSEFFKEGTGTYFDIGANVGLTTIPIATYKGVRCVAFEPDPMNFGYLQHNVAINCPDGNVELNNVAIADRNGALTFELSPHNSGDHRLRMAQNASLLGEDSWPTTDVLARRLDEFRGVIARPFAVKIDVQGAEPLVVSGGVGTLEQADLVILEFSPYWMNRMGADPGVVIDFIRGFPKVALAQGETGDVRAYATGVSASDELRRIFDEHRNIPVGAYWDVIARRS